MAADTRTSSRYQAPVERLLNSLGYNPAEITSLVLVILPDNYVTVTVTKKASMEQVGALTEQLEANPLRRRHDDEPACPAGR